MKFGKRLESSLVPEWREQFLNYKKLKKYIFNYCSKEKHKKKGLRQKIQNLSDFIQYHTQPQQEIELALEVEKKKKSFLRNKNSDNLCGSSPPSADTNCSSSGQNSSAPQLPRPHPSSPYNPYRLPEVSEITRDTLHFAEFLRAQAQGIPVPMGPKEVALDETQGIRMTTPPSQMLDPGEHLEECSIIFRQMLEEEIEKVNKFYTKMEEKYEKRHRELLAQIQQMVRREAASNSL